MMYLRCFFFQAEDGIRDLVRSRGLGDVYKRQPHRDVEIRRGLGGAALAVFSQISAGRLAAPQAEQLRLIQNQLDLLEGNAERVAVSMARLKWDLNDEYAAEAYRLSLIHISEPTRPS